MYYSVNLPYPEVHITKPNRRYATIISGAYAGKGSESTAIAQYSVHRYYVQDYPDIFNAYKYIAYVEMIHWELLGNLVKDLGLSPKLISYETSAFWSGRFPAHETELSRILQSDIDGERDAVAHYQRMIRAIDNQEIQDLFCRIILDEEKHIEVLTNLYARYK
jgi:bacterioferritin